MTIGGDGDSIQFGQIRSVVGWRDSLFVLDSHRNQVFVIRGDGKLLQVLGRPGIGPGEIADGIGMDVTRSGDIVIADGNRRVTIFRKDGESYSFKAAFDVDFSPTGICVLDETIFMRGLRVSSQDPLEYDSVHRYSMSGALIGSMKAPYWAANVEVMNYMTEGPRLVCDSDLNMVVVAYHRLPIVTAFRSTGEIVWNSRIDRFQGQSLVEAVAPNGSPAVRMSVPGRGMEIPAYLSQIVDGAFLLQIMQFDANGEQADSYSLFSISASSGDGHAVGKSSSIVHGRYGHMALIQPTGVIPTIQVDRSGDWMIRAERDID